MTYQLHLGDCLDVLATLPDNSVDSIVTDPPYGLSFMGKKWDYDVPSVAIWEQCLRVLKPGGHLLAFAGTRTQHRMACRIEDAGFEIRDMIAWVYGSGFPKSHNLEGDHKGWGTALKPALEPITMARKPFSSTVAANVIQYGTGAINIDGCRVGTDGGGWGGGGSTMYEGGLSRDGGEARPVSGRWPANIIHDGSNEAALSLKSGARFFYTAKAAKDDRNDGCYHLEVKQTTGGGGLGNPVSGAYGSEKAPGNNHHPTVKPTMLMAYLCRLITQPGGTILDPFMGSGSTGKAATINGFRFIGIERDPEYHKISEARISNQHEGRLF
jgi:site-specific DNA-methyltransferase (adenine-specific)